ncbi:MAG: ATP-binding cassette domain-containing protein [Nitriliruptoraceae bacterium]
MTTNGQIMVSPAPSTVRVAHGSLDIDAVVSMRAVSLRIGGNQILHDVTLDVRRQQHLAVLGPNGAGKTSLLRLMSTYRHPTSGAVQVLGTQFGKGDLRPLRARLGFVSVALDPLLHERANALPLVAAALVGATWPPAGILEDAAVCAAAEDALVRVGASHLADRRVDTLSQGERQRVRIARALAPQPDLLLLDEPFAGLDLGGRETLIADLDRLLADAAAPTVVMVTHHVEELPVGVADVVLLRNGTVMASGAADTVLTDDVVSETFDAPVSVQLDRGRWRATVRAAL